jgi:ubiquinone/menaquinone biosynthesis C-methylase UbiE
MTQEREYVLGTEDAEIQRLRFQHETWRAQALALWERAGIREGQRVADLGCGPGYTTLDLAGLVGPRGQVLALDQSERFLKAFAAARDATRMDWIEVRLGPLEELDLPPGSLDAAYARWLLSWVGDPCRVLEPVARALRPGGAIVLQEYLDWGAMKLVPRSSAFDVAVRACLESWENGVARIDVAETFPDLAKQLGLVLEHLEPVARSGRPGSMVWRWPMEFLRSYLRKLIERGFFTAEGLRSFESAVDEREQSGTGLLLGPMMADAILRKH